MKELHVATDIYDEIHHNRRFYEPRHFQALMAYCRELGATTIDWILDDVWTLYEDYPGGIDLLATAVESAHREGLKFHVVYKPFEGALAHLVLPQTAPRPAGAVLWEDLRGLVPIVRPFVAAHPRLCFKRRPEYGDRGSPVRAIRLVKNDEEPLPLEPGDLSIWIGRTNGSFERYEGSFELSQSVEWRPVFPLGRACRVLTLGGLEIAAEQRYIEVRFADGALDGHRFRNDYLDLVELVGDEGTIPSTPALAEGLRDWCCHQLAQPFMSRLVRYARMPDPAGFLADGDRIAEAAGELRGYASDGAAEYALDEKGRIAVARGKVRYLPGLLNPVYEKVRQEWLRIVRFCIERDVDAVNFRSSYHLRPQESGEYGFNPPVLEAIGGNPDTARAARVIGDAYTTFLREARELLHAGGKRIGVHLLGYFMQRPDDGGPRRLHENMEAQWEKWVAEVVDFAEFRGAMGLRAASLRHVVDRFADACRRASIPLVYQSNRRIFDKRRDALHLDPDRLRWLEHEMAFALSHKGVSAYQLYETANFTRLNEDGEFEGSDEMRRIARRFGFGA